MLICSWRPLPLFYNNRACRHFSVVLHLSVITVLPLLPLTLTMFSLQELLTKITTQFAATGDGPGIAEAFDRTYRFRSDSARVADGAGRTARSQRHSIGGNAGRNGVEPAMNRLSL